MKKCSRCSVEKPTFEFYKCKGNKTGFQSRCKSCCSSLGKVWHSDNSDVVSLKRKEYNSKHKDIQAEAKKIWAEANKERVIANKKKWEEENAERRLVQRREYVKNNIQRVREVSKVWKEANKGKLCSYENKRRAGVLQRTPKWANLQAIADVYELASFVGEVMGKKFHVDHIVPLQGKYVSGLHVENNLQIISAEENQRKYNKHYG